MVYTMSVTVSQTGINLFGVGIEALTAAGTNAGTLTITDAASTQIKTVTIGTTSRRNIVHQLNGGASPNSKVFNFSWTAPAAGTGNVTFYFSGVAANGTGNENGDWVYNANQVFTEACNPPSQPSSITGNLTACSGSQETYTVAAVSGATTYTWTLPSGWTGTSTTNSITVTAGSTSGDITVTANNTCGSSPVTTLTVTGNPLPTSSINISNDTLYATPGAVSYQWYLGGNPVSSAQYDWYLPTQNGSYTVEVTDANGCVGTSSAFNYTTLGINSLSGKQSFSIFPNPVSNIVQVKATGVLRNTLFTIYDVTGHIVLQATLENETNSYDVSNLSEGVYFATAGKDENKTVARFYINR
jgi:hypothetical protein